MKTNHISEPQKLHFIGKEAFEEAYRIQEEKIKLLNQIENLMIRLSQYELSPKISRVDVQDTTHISAHSMQFYIHFKTHLSSKHHLNWVSISFKKIPSTDSPIQISFLFADHTTGHFESLDKALEFLLGEWGKCSKPSLPIK